MPGCSHDFDIVAIPKCRTCGTRLEEWWIHVPLPMLAPRRRRGAPPEEKARNPSPWLTLNDRDHWARRKSLTKYFRDAALGEATDARLPALHRVHITAYVAHGSNRRLDPHNYILTVKAIVDGLVDHGLIPDDNSKHLIGPDMRRDEGLDRGITLHIVDLGEG